MMMPSIKLISAIILMALLLMIRSSYMLNV